ncbi:hypothetical protein [Salinigranum halophilum]|jgi:hypothetical protein|uniref:hypothetical protein n=1 Tax=Salinigranum halophilum TaxID=2565931 RepID=UPI00115E6977|nr:hypothetical protein [Salinigranum halophilum]
MIRESIRETPEYRAEAVEANERRAGAESSISVEKSDAQLYLDVLTVVLLFLIYTELRGA